jgi:hypothetical protein
MTKQEAEEAAAVERKRHANQSARIHAARVEIARQHAGLYNKLRAAKPTEDDANG